MNNDDDELGAAFRVFQKACDHVWNTVGEVTGDSNVPKVARAAEELLIEVDRARHEVTMQFAALHKAVRAIPTTVTTVTTEDVDEESLMEAAAAREVLLWTTKGNDD